MTPGSSWSGRARHRMRSRRLAGTGVWVTQHPYGRELLALVRQIVRESGEGTAPFDARGWLAAFLMAPSPALGGQLPVHLLDDAEARLQVRQLLLRMQSGAYG